MKCSHCKAPMTKGTAPFSADKNGYHISLDSVPAWVCTQCGESLFEAKEVEHIQNALKKVDDETKFLQLESA